MHYHFKTHDHPEAVGRKPRPGEAKFYLDFPLEEGGNLRVHCGLDTFRKFVTLIDEWRRDYGTCP